MSQRHEDAQDFHILLEIWCPNSHFSSISLPNSNIFVSLIQPFSIFNTWTGYFLKKWGVLLLKVAIHLPLNFFPSLQTFKKNRMNCSFFHPEMNNNNIMNLLIHLHFYNTFFFNLKWKIIEIFQLFACVIFHLLFFFMENK